MKIETKFQPGDMVHRLHDNKVQLLEVVATEIRVAPRAGFENQIEPNSTTIRYWLKIGGDNSDRVEHESNIFSTKAELLASL